MGGLIAPVPVTRRANKGALAFPYSALSSATPDAPHRSAERIDPYWDGIWTQGAAAAWMSRARMAKLTAAGVLSARRTKLYSADPAEARVRIFEPRNWQIVLDVLGVLASWRTVTVEQLCALTGHYLGADTGTNRHPTLMMRVLADMFALDLIDLGELWGATGTRANRARMIRPSASKAFDTLIRPHMSYAEWVSVTAGQKFLSGGQYDRHNLLTVELGLRVAEHVPVGLVLGERQAVVNDLAYTSFGKEPPMHASQQAADCLIIRPDGVRIAVEVTATWGQYTTKKAEQWAAVLANRAFADTGLMVVFVVADRPDSVRGSLANLVRRRLSKVVRLNPGQAGNRVAERMMVVDWRDWFPERGMVSAEFLQLMARRPTGPEGDHRWDEEVSPLDAAAFPTPPHERAPLLFGVNHYAAGLRCAPWQLRQGRQTPDFGRMLLERFGFTKVPRIVFDPRTGERREDPTRQIGAVSPPKPPRRQRF